MPYTTTDVPVSKSQGAIEELLRRRGAVATRVTHLIAEGATIEFVMKIDGQPRAYRIRVKRPEKQVKALLRSQYGGTRKVSEAAWDRLDRATWRAAYWYIKSRFEAVEFGLVDTEEAFLSNLVLGTGTQSSTVAEMVKARMIGLSAGGGGDPFAGMLPPPSEAPQQGEEQ